VTLRNEDEPPANTLVEETLQKLRDAVKQSSSK
jgi:hypothetical protein